MEKILVNLKVPACGLSFDCRIPGYLTARQAADLLCDSAAALSNGVYSRSGDEVLCRGEDGKLLARESTLKESGITTGDHLILF